MSNRVFWGFALLLFLCMSYTLSFNLVYSIEDFAPLTAQFEDNSVYADGFAPDTLWQHWPCCDSEAWLDHTNVLGSAIPPFRYRVAIPASVRLIPLPPVYAWQLWNALVFMVTGTLMTSYLMRYYSVTRSSALLGGVLLMTIVPVTRTMLVPGIDISTILIMVLLMVALQERHILGYILVAIFAVLTKEIFILAAPLWIAFNRFGWRWVLAIVPLAVFVGVRLVFGASPVEVNYGYDLLDSAQAAQATHYARLTPETMGAFLIALFLSLGMVWTGFIAALKSDKLTMRAVLIVTILVTVAIFFLSSQVQRNTGLIAVVLIPPLIQRLEATVW